MRKLILSIGLLLFLTEITAFTATKQYSRDPLETQKALTAGERCAVSKKNRLVIAARKRLFHHYNITAVCRISQLADIPVEDYKAAGISKILFYVSNPVVINDQQQPAWISSAKRDEIFRAFKAFEKSGIELIPITAFFYEKNPAESEGKADAKMLQQSRWSTKQRYRCFSSNLDTTTKRLQFMVKELTQFPNFTGICLDDEAGVVAGGCTCDRCRKMFTEQYKTSVPAKADYTKLKKGVTVATQPILLWDKFNKAQLKKFYLELAIAAQQVNPKLNIFTIPAAAYYSGKQLSIKNCQDKDFFKSARNVTLDPTHVRDYQLYVQFYINQLTSTGWQKKCADGLCLYMMQKGLPNFSNIPIYDADKSGNSKSKLISPVAFKRFILQTFAEGGNGIVYFPYSILTKAHRQIAADCYSKVIKPVINDIGRLNRLRGQVGILYSSTSRAVADIWKNNPIERYKQLYECDAVAYYLKKRGIPFSMVLENELINRKGIQAFSTVILPDVNYLSPKTVEILTAYIRNGGKVILNSATPLDISGATKVDFNAAKWYESIVDATASIEGMEKQWLELDKTLAPLLPETLAICRSTNHQLNINYLTNGKNIYLFLVNNNLKQPLKSLISFNRSYEVKDISNHKTHGKINNLKVNIEPAGIKIIKLKI